jgi:hypothetical protein
LSIVCIYGKLVLPQATAMLHQKYEREITENLRGISLPERQPIPTPPPLGHHEPSNAAENKDP